MRGFIGRNLGAIAAEDIMSASNRLGIGNEGLKEAKSFSQ
jgi:hypothetical protein